MTKHDIELDLTDEQFRIADRIEDLLRRSPGQHAEDIPHRAGVDPAGAAPVLAWMVDHCYVHTLTALHPDRDRDTVRYYPGRP